MLTILRQSLSRARLALFHPKPSRETETTTDDDDDTRLRKRRGVV